MTTEPPASGATLAPVVRAQVVAVAADVLGRLPGEDVPPGLRPFARFAPAKRQRLGASAIAAALDADETFRSAVADVVEQGSPDLVAALRAGEMPAAAEPVDIAIVAYLSRPDGWPEVLVEANRRIGAEKGAASSAEVDTLRSELAELRRHSRGEAARVKAAVAEAEQRFADEIAQLRTVVRDRTRELRAAERERDEARAGVAEAIAGKDNRAAGLESELRRVRARLADVERASEAARRDARTDREVDDARLWLLVDTLMQAAAGVRRELSLPPPQVRPADTVQAAASTADTTGRRVARDPAEFDRLLAMPHVHVVVDGYNVTKSGYPQLPLADQRTRLVTSLAALAGRSGAEVTVAFDGGQRPPAQPPVPRGVRVLFSAPDEIADDLIRRLVAAEPTGRPVVVVTSDRAVADDTARAGAWTVDSAVLLARIERVG